SALGQEAIFTFRLQMFVLYKELGRLTEIEGVLASFVDDYPRPLCRCLLANLHSAIGHNDPARLIFEEFAADAFALPHDDEWLLSSIMLTEVCTALSDVPRAAVLYDLLLPH